MNQEEKEFPNKNTVAQDIMHREENLSAVGSTGGDPSSEEPREELPDIEALRAEAVIDNKSYWNFVKCFFLSPKLYMTYFYGRITFNRAFAFMYGSTFVTTILIIIGIWLALAVITPNQLEVNALLDGGLARFILIGLVVNAIYSLFAVIGAIIYSYVYKFLLQWLMKIRISTPSFVASSLWLSTNMNMINLVCLILGMFLLFLHTLGLPIEIAIDIFIFLVIIVLFFYNIYYNYLLGYIASNKISRGRVILAIVLLTFFIIICNSVLQVLGV